MRCLTLAEALRSRGAICHFVSRRNPGNLIELIEQRGFVVYPLPSAPEPFDLFAVNWRTDASETSKVLAGLDADWLVVDHYGLSAEWEEQRALPSCRRFVIDDLSNRDHVADILLNQNLGADAKAYTGRVPENCLILAGARYALLRPEFQMLRDAKQAIGEDQEQPERNLLISFGGSDPPNATGWVLGQIAAQPLPDNWKVTVVMGSGALALEGVKEKAASIGPLVKLIENTLNMAELMQASDLALGAGGATSWERCCLGLPTILVVLAENQQPAADALSSVGASLNIRLGDDAALGMALGALTGDSARRATMSRAARAVCDGGGVARVVEAMLSGD